MNDELDKVQWKCQVCGYVANNQVEVDQHLKATGHVNAGVEVDQGRGRKTVEGVTGIEDGTIPVKGGQTDTISGAKDVEDDAEETFDETAS